MRHDTRPQNGEPAPATGGAQPRRGAKPRSKKPPEGRTRVPKRGTKEEEEDTSKQEQEDAKVKQRYEEQLRKSRKPCEMCVGMFPTLDGTLTDIQARLLGQQRYLCAKCAKNKCVLLPFNLPDPSQKFLSVAFPDRVHIGIGVYKPHPTLKCIDRYLYDAARRSILRGEKMAWIGPHAVKTIHAGEHSVVRVVDAETAAKYNTRVSGNRTVCRCERPCQHLHRRSRDQDFRAEGTPTDEDTIDHVGKSLVPLGGVTVCSPDPLVPEEDPRPRPVCYAFTEPNPYEVLELLAGGHKVFAFGYRLHDSIGVMPGKEGWWTTTIINDNMWRHLHIDGAKLQYDFEYPAWMHDYNSWSLSAPVDFKSVYRPPWASVRGGVRSFSSDLGAAIAKYHTYVKKSGFTGFHIEEKFGNDDVFFYEFTGIDVNFVPGLGPRLRRANNLDRANREMTTITRGKPSREIFHDHKKITIYEPAWGAQVFKPHKEEEVIVPIALVAFARSFAVNKVRDDKLFSAATLAVREEATRIGYPEKHFGGAVAAAVTIGLLEGVDMETSYLSAYAGYMNLQPGRMFSWKWWRSFYDSSANATRSQLHEMLRAAGPRRPGIPWMLIWVIVFALVSFIAIAIAVEQHSVVRSLEAEFHGKQAMAGGLNLPNATVTRPVPEEGLGGTIADPQQALELAVQATNVRVARRLLGINEHIVPLVEESVKRLAGNHGYVIALMLSMAEAAHVGPTAQGLRLLFTKFSLHYILWLTPFPLAVFIHMWWNSSITREKKQRLRGNFDELFASTGTATALNGVRAVMNLCQSDRLCHHEIGVEMRPTAQFQPPTKLKCEPRESLWLYGVGLLDAIPTTFRACWHNEEKATLGRALKVVPWSASEVDEQAQKEFVHGGFDEPDPYLGVSLMKLRYDICPDAAVRVFWLETYQLREKHAWLWPEVKAKLWDGDLRPVDFLEWKARFPQISQRLDDAHEGVRQGIRDLRFSAEAFIKQENAVTLTPFTDNSDKDARLIQGRNDSIKVFSGPQTLAVHKLMRAVLQLDKFHRFLPVVYGPGLTAEELGQWKKESLDDVRLVSGEEAISFEGDASRWDCHVHRGMLEAQTEVYRELFPGEDNFLRAMEERHGTTRKGCTKLGARYRVTGTVFSGDGDTTSANTFGHYMIFVRVLTLMLVDKFGTRDCYSLDQALALPFRAIVMGDDMLVITSPTLLPTIRQLVEQVTTFAGHEYKFKYGHHMLGEFCSGRFYPVVDGSGYVFGPKPGRVLAKTFWSRTAYRRAKQLGWVRGVAMSLDKACAFVPVLRVLIPIILGLTDGARVIEDKQTRRHFETQEVHRADNRVWLMMYHVYGLSQQEIEECEDYLIRTVTALPISVEHPVLTRMVEIDT
jgi:hypothetical protein